MRIEGLVLAAGFSSRAPGFKMTLPLCGQTVIEHTIQKLLLYCDRVIVVGGYCYEKLIPICDKYEQVKLIYNDRYQQGMFSSIQRGIEVLDCDYFFMTPGDYPLVAIETYAELIANSGEAVIPSYHGKGGHPLLINAKYIDQCLRAGVQDTMREVLKTIEVTYIPVEDEGVLIDVDTAKDYVEVRRRCNSENQ